MRALLRVHAPVGNPPEVFHRFPVARVRTDSRAQRKRRKRAGRGESVAFTYAAWPTKRLLGQVGPDAPKDPLRAPTPGRGENQRKLVASQSAGHIAPALRSPKQPSDLAKQKIARGMPRQVIHKLEVVEVDDRERQTPIGALSALKFLSHPLVEEPTVVEPSQVVAIGQVSISGKRSDLLP